MVDIVEAALRHPDNSDKWGVLQASAQDADTERLCSDAAHFGFHLASNRGWSLLLEFSLVPIAYAPILSRATP